MLIILSCLLPGRCRYSPEWAAGLPQAGSAILGLIYVENPLLFGARQV